MNFNPDPKNKLRKKYLCANRVTADTSLTFNSSPVYLCEILDNTVDLQENLRQYLTRQIIQ